MKKYLILALCFTPTLASAESTAVQELNYNITSSAGFSPLTGTNLNLSGEVRFPVAGNVGLSLNAGLAKSEGKKDFVDSTSQFFGLGLFLKKHDIGSIEARYDHTNSKSDDNTLPNLEAKLKSSELNGTYYFNRFDVSAARSESKIENTVKLKTSKFGTAYYITDNLKVSAAITNFDKLENVEKKNAYLMSASYQPTFFNNALSTTLSYTDNNDDNTTTLSVSYYFDTKVSLIDRDRKY